MVITPLLTKSMMISCSWIVVVRIRLMTSSLYFLWSSITWRSTDNGTYQTYERLSSFLRSVRRWWEVSIRKWWRVLVEWRSAKTLSSLITHIIISGAMKRDETLITYILRWDTAGDHLWVFVGRSKEARISNLTYLCRQTYIHPNTM